MEIKHNISISPSTYYKIGGLARDVYFPENIEDIDNAYSSIIKDGYPFYILGGGTNVLVGDKYWDGAVISTLRMNYHISGQSSLICGAGLLSSKVAEIACEHSKTGLEFLYLLPGTIGGAISGNARFEGINISERILSIIALGENGLNKYEPESIVFAYKYNNLTASGMIIVEACLSWNDGDVEKIKDDMEKIETFRNKSHHFDYPSCGCIFKNNHERNIQAGHLIDSLGLKGMRIGGAEVSPFHANFIINNGNASAADVLSLIEKIEKTVYDKTGIELEREVKLLGAF